MSLTTPRAVVMVKVNLSHSTTKDRKAARERAREVREVKKFARDAVSESWLLTQFNKGKLAPPLPRDTAPRSHRHGQESSRSR